MNKHTPGPWKVDSKTNEDGPMIFSKKGCLAVTPTCWSPNYEANARLIAEAPAMYAAMREILDSKHGNDELFDSFRAILARVEGK